ncbi:hypothetical protein AGABI1DRAFT_77017 [Agaricus bisporus var. burnettii JB137-S8]|uniref:FAS1 domain-containing protein n=1 Tax=Agaricus bisporus var. burnettii (strain JB137-S8 / ATCC MYA-4627 / FGSC 10392) TaxID=597362 RepID=K5VST7_AGABU|nr:uncharacterized protein AGABI1DRAFT_77017 [Agaricus bisporus var. burnettii JB137-S8]EKM77524.1 hypothetical protein AGABI1DRAFT_77017 [Agaricus bisporus var. burnettii JB137-S8]
MFSSVAFTLLTVALPTVLAQSSDSGYLQGLVNELNAIGYSGAANALSRANGTSSGQQFLSQVQDGNFTVFVPTNAAFENLPSNVTSDDDLVAKYLAYHFVYGSFQNTSATNSSGGGGGGTTSSASASESSSTASSTEAFAWYQRRDEVSNSSDALLSGIYPNTTIGRTLLNSSDLVQLEANKSQVLAWTRIGGGNVTLLNQPNISVANSSTYENLFLNSIDGVIIPPGNLSTVLNATNATAFVAFAQQVNTTNSDGSNTSAVNSLEQENGFTLFVPDNDAFQAAQQTIGGFQNNQTALKALLGNHIINGTTLYTPDFQNATASGSGANYITAAGENLSVSSNSSGIFLQNQNGSVAQITRPDVLVSNGVFHVIDNVLVETDSNPEAASSAVMSASSAATAQSSTDTLPIGGGATLTSAGATSTPALLRFHRAL